AADAVAAELAHDAVAELVGQLLDRAADVPEIRVGHGHGDAVVEGAFGHFHQLFGVRGNRTHGEGARRVAVIAVQQAGHVDVDDVAFPQDLRPGNAVADHVVDRRAHRFGKAVVVQGRGVSPGLDGRLVDEGVDVVGGDAGLHEFARADEDFRGELAGFTKQGDFAVGLDFDGHGGNLVAEGAARSPLQAEWVLGTRYTEGGSETRGGRIFCSFPAYETDAFCRRGFRGPSRGLRRRLPRDREAGGFRVFAGQLPPRRQALRRSL